MTDLENHKIVPEKEDLPWVAVNKDYLFEDQMGNKIYRNFLKEEAN